MMTVSEALSIAATQGVLSGAEKSVGSFRAELTYDYLDWDITIVLIQPDGYGKRTDKVLYCVPSTSRQGHTPSCRNAPTLRVHFRGIN